VFTSVCHWVLEFIMYLIELNMPINISNNNCSVNFKNTRNYTN